MKNSRKIYSFPKLYSETENGNCPVYDLSKKKIIIPLYQRNYRWKTTNVDCLLTDIINKFDKGKDIWLGTILVSISRDGSVTLIDGQQRLITMFLIFKEFKVDTQVSKIVFEETELQIYKDEDQDSINSEVIGKYLNSSSKDFLKKFPFLNKLVQKIRKYYKKSEDHKFIEYLEQSVYCTILTLEDNYEFFENLNSKNLPLTLAEKCVAFLTGTFLKNKQNHLSSFFRTKIKFLKFLCESKIGSNNIIERFVDIIGNFTDENNYFVKNDYFASFKNFTSQEIGLRNFFIFLKIIYELEREDHKENFQKLYFWHICRKDYWLIYVWSKLQNQNSSQFLDLFLKEVWKFDLIRHLNGLAKTSIKKDVINFVKNKNFGLSEWHNLMSKIMSTSSNGFSITEDQKKKILFKGRAKDISYAIPNFKKDRFVALFYLLYTKKPLQELNAQNFFSEKNRTEKDKLTVDHLLPLSKVKIYNSYAEIEIGSNLIKNLWLLKASDNQNFSDTDIDKKMQVSWDWNHSVPMLNLYNEVRNNWNKTKNTNIFQKSLNSEKVNIIKEFWTKREKVINIKINNIRDEYLSIVLDYLKFDVNLEKRKLEKKKQSVFIKNRLELVNVSPRSNKKFFSKKKKVFVYFSFFDFKGVKAGDKTRVQMNHDNFEWFRKKRIELSNSMIIGYHLTNKKFYLFKNWTKFYNFTRYSNPSLHFNSDWEEYNL